MQMPVSKEDYLKLSDQYDKHARALCAEKGEEYSLAQDFLAMENKIAGLVEGDPAFLSLILAAKHIAAMFVIIQKTPTNQIDLKKWDERVRDGCNLIKIASAFIHAEQKDFDVKV